MRAHCGVFFKMRGVTRQKRCFFVKLAKYGRIIAGGIICLALLCAFITIPTSPAQAQCQNCGCVPPAHALIRGHIRTQFELHRQRFVIGYFFHRHVMHAMMDMTEQLTASAMMQMMAIGAFLDAKHQLETQQLFQKLAARAHKDFHSSTELCTMGTIARGLGHTSRNAEATAIIMAQRSQGRQMGNANVNAAAGPDIDRRGRIDTLKKHFCYTADNDLGLESLCGQDAPAESINKDVDFTRTVYNPLTIDVDFSDGQETPDEIAVLALSNNLYAHETFPQLFSSLLTQSDNQDILVDLRSVVAKRSVAEHSFNSIVGMKAAGSAASESKAPYLNVVLEQLGVPSDEAEEILGERPSYHAQMELLTKTLYQNPQFYTALYDTPGNLDRKAAALRAISLMQDMDKFKSRLRNEAALSMFLEMSITRYQEDIENRLKQQRSEGAQ